MEQSTTRRALRGGTTHILRFGHYCGASRLDRWRGIGLWDLMTVDQYNQGLPDSGRHWPVSSPKGTPVRDLTILVSAWLGHLVALARADDLAGPGWVVAYRVRPAAS